jgi:hypothetical protein
MRDWFSALCLTSLPPINAQTATLHLIPSRTYQSQNTCTALSLGFPLIHFTHACNDMLIFLCLMRTQYLSRLLDTITILHLRMHCHAYLTPHRSSPTQCASHTRVFHSCDHPRVFLTIFTEAARKYCITPANIFNMDEKGYMLGITGLEKVIIMTRDHRDGYAGGAKQCK